MWHQTLCGIEDAEKVEDGVVDVPWAQEDEAPGDPHQEGKTQHSEAAPAGLGVPFSLGSNPVPERSFHPTDPGGHNHQYDNVEDEYEGEIRQIQGVEEGLVCDPATEGH